MPVLGGVTKFNFHSAHFFVMLIIEQQCCIKQQYSLLWSFAYYWGALALHPRDSDLRIRLPYLQV